MLHSILIVIWIVKENRLIRIGCRGLNIRRYHLIVVADYVYGVNANVVNLPIDVKVDSRYRWMGGIFHLRTSVPCFLLMRTFLITCSAHYRASSLLEVAEV
jgi:hypothetical protein